MKKITAVIIAILAITALWVSCSGHQSNPTSTPTETSATTEFSIEPSGSHFTPTTSSISDFSFDSESFIEEQSEDPEAIIVYVTKTGEKYHMDGCQYLRKSQIPMSLEDAINEGYTPCSKCHPPT